MLCTTFSNSNKLRKSNKGVAIYNSLKCMITSIFFRGNHSLASASGIFDNYHKLCSFCSHKETHIFAPPRSSMFWYFVFSPKMDRGKSRPKRSPYNHRRLIINLIRYTFILSGSAFVIFGWYNSGKLMNGIFWTISHS